MKLTGGLRMKFSRHFQMANADTFSMPIVGDWVKSRLENCNVSIDPFARNKRWATHTNDLNPDTLAEYHMEALDFLIKIREENVKADLIIFDPPYNPAQAKQCYQLFGYEKLPIRIARTAGAWAAEKDICKDILTNDGLFLWFGWNSCGMGKGREFDITEIMLIAHGRGKQDTICMEERRTK